MNMFHAHRSTVALSRRLPGQGQAGAPEVTEERPSEIKFTSHILWVLCFQL
jgi:hypothetical protein